MSFSERINVVSPGRVGLHRRPRGLARPDQPLGVNIMAVFGRIEITVMLPQPTLLIEQDFATNSCLREKPS